MNTKEATHAAHMRNVERIKNALSLTIREMEAELTHEPSEVFDAIEETTLALRGKIRVLVLGLRSLLKAVNVASRNRFTPEVNFVLQREAQAAAELLALLNESLD